MKCKDHKCKECGNTTGRPASECVWCGAPLKLTEPPDDWGMQ